MCMKSTAREFGMQMLKKRWVAYSLVSGCAAALSGPAHPTDGTAQENLIEWNVPDHPPSAAPLHEALGAFLDGDNLPEIGIARAQAASVATLHANAAGPEAPPGFPGWIAVDSTMLEQMRGGFDIAPGLRVSFGIERLVNLNGVLQTATRIEVPDAGKLLQPSPVQGTPVPAGSPASTTPVATTSPAAAADANSLPPAANVANSTTGLVQNGLGNLFSPATLAQGTVGTFIQNSVNNQTIQSLTIINATTNSLELLKGANLQSTLFDALTQSAGAR